MRHINPLRRPAQLTIGVAAIATLALGAGCNASPATSTSTATSGVSAGGQQRAQSKIEQASQAPTFKAGPAIDMKSLSGKKITVLTSTLAVPFVANIAKGVQEAGALVGWQVTVVDGKGSVTEWSRIMQQAVAQKVDGVITVGASPAEMQPAVAAAQAAGIPVVDTLTADQNKDPLIPGTFAHTSISFYDSGALQADYVVANGSPTAHVLIFGDNEFPGEVTRVQGMQDEFAKLCPGCTVTFQDTQVAKLATDLGQTAVTLARRDPSLEWVLPTYDAQALYVIPALKTAGLASKIKVVGSDAVSSNLQWVKDGNVQVADVGEPNAWSGWAAVDMMGRALTKTAPVDPNIPLRVFTTANLSSLDPANEDQLFGGGFRDGYKKVWGLS